MWWAKSRPGSPPVHPSHLFRKPGPLLRCRRRLVPPHQSHEMFVEPCVADADFVEASELAAVGRFGVMPTPRSEPQRTAMPRRREVHQNPAGPRHTRCLLREPSAPLSVWHRGGTSPGLPDRTGTHPPPITVTLSKRTGPESGTATVSIPMEISFEMVSLGKTSNRVAGCVAVATYKTTSSE